MADLHQVAAKSDTNLMTIQNIATVIGPNLLYPKNRATDVFLALKEVTVMNAITEMMMVHFCELFLKEEEPAAQAKQSKPPASAPGDKTQPKQEQNKATTILSELKLAKQNSLGQISGNDLYSLLSGCGANCMEDLVREDNEPSHIHEQAPRKKPHSHHARKKSKTHKAHETDTGHAKTEKHHTKKKSKHSKKEKVKGQEREDITENKEPRILEQEKRKDAGGAAGQQQKDTDVLEEHKEPAKGAMADMDAAKILDGHSKVLRIKDIRSKWKKLEGESSKDNALPKKSPKKEDGKD